MKTHSTDFLLHITSNVRHTHSFYGCLILFKLVSYTFISLRIMTRKTMIKIVLPSVPTTIDQDDTPLKRTKKMKKGIEDNYSIHS